MNITTQQFLDAVWQGEPGNFRMFHEKERNNPGRSYQGQFDDVEFDMLCTAVDQYGSFFVVNGGGDSDGAINKFNAVFIDIDGDHGQTYPTTWHTPPNIVTQRGSNFHAYWLLEPGTITDAETWKTIQRQLIEFYKSDRVIKNPSRVMRLPNTDHMKDMNNITQYKIFHFSVEHRYNAANVAAGLPAIDDTPTQRDQGVSIVDDSQFNIDKAIAFLARSDGESEGRNDHMFRMAARLRDFGLSEDTTFGLLIEHEYPKLDQSGDLFDFDELAHVVSSAYKYASNSQGVDAVRFEIDVEGVTRVVSAAQAPSEGSVVVPPPLDAAEAYLIAEELGTTMKYAIEMQLSAWGELIADWVPVEFKPNTSALYKMVSTTFWSPSKSHIYVLCDNGYLNEFSERDAMRMLERLFGKIFQINEIKEQIKSLGERSGQEKSAITTLNNWVKDYIYETVFDHIKCDRQRLQSSAQVDLFNRDMRVSMAPNEAVINIAYKPYKAARPVAEANLDMRVISDYKEHFPQLEEFLDFIVASRMANDRKNAYLWLKCESDWGKSFLMASLTSMNAGVEVSIKEVKKMLNGDPCGTTPAQFTSSLALMIDEFSSVNAEFKQLQNHLSFAPKNMMKVKVPLYAKVMASAESVSSLVSEYGVEDQFANRINMYSCKGVLPARKLWCEVGSDHYEKHVFAYVAMSVNKRIAAYIEMGVEASAMEGYRFLKDFHARNGIDKHVDRFSDTMVNIVADFKEWCLLARRKGLGEGKGVMVDCNNTLAEKVAACVDVTPEHMYIRKPQSLFNEWVNTTLPHSNKVMVALKYPEIIPLLSCDGKGVHPYFVNNATRKAIKSELEGVVIPDNLLLGVFKGG